MTVYLVMMVYTRGLAVAGVFSTIEQAKSAAEYAADTEPPESFGVFVKGSVSEFELDRVYTQDDEVTTHDYKQQFMAIPFDVN